VVLDRRYHNRELEMMKGLEHECVIKLHHHFEKPGKKRDESYLHLVMDYMPETIRSLSLQYQKERTRFPIDHVRLYLYQCLKALEYVHSKRICHRDLKPDNLLVDPSRQRLKVTSTMGVE
jgi:serine/threonine protein kinase